MKLEDRLGHTMTMYQIDAVNGLLDFSKAMANGELSITDLAETFPHAIQGGWDMLSIQLSMAQEAVRIAKPKE